MTDHSSNAIIFVMLILKFAFRNLIRHWRRTSITIVAMTFGLTVNFWLDCMLRGRNEEVARLVTSSFTGNFQIYTKLFFEEKTISSQLDLDENQVQQAIGPQGDFSLRTHLPSLISSGETSAPILLEGIRPESEKKVSTLAENIKSGDFLSTEATCSPGEILIGTRLAKSLKVDLGEKVVLLTQSADGSLGNELFRVKGIYETGSSNFDKAYAFTQEKCAFQLGQVRAPHEVVVRVKNTEDQEQVFDRLKPLVKQDQILMTWRESLPAVARMVKVNNAIMGLVSIILLVVVILGFVNTLLMSVLERTREIGMMMAIGITPAQVQSLIVLEALLIAVFSSVISIILGLLIVLYYQKTGFNLAVFVGENFDADQINLGLIIYPKISMWPFFKVIGLSLVTVFISVLLPAHRASNLSPVDALRSN
jgi:ABC-type lipoprotein release transport system permease subunit